MTTDRTTLVRSLSIQARVIGALIRREFITRYGRYNIGFMWLFAEPMMFTVGVIVLWRYLHQSANHGTQVTVVSFVVTGYSAVMLWRNGTARCAKAVEPNLGLLYHRNVQVIDLMAARVILEIAGATISLVALVLICTTSGIIEPPADILRMAAGWLLLSWYTLALGLIVGAISEFSEAFERIYHVSMYLYLPLSGAFFLVDWLPSRAQKYALWIPTVHATEMFRSGYYGGAVHTHYSTSYLALANVLLMLVGLALVAYAGRRVEPQ